MFLISACLRDNPLDHYVSLIIFHLFSSPTSDIQRGCLPSGELVYTYVRHRESSICTDENALRFCPGMKKESDVIT